MSESAASESAMIVPIAIEKSFLEGKGLTPGDPNEFDGEGIEHGDGGETYEFAVGDSLVVPKGDKGVWHMPEKYGELIIIDTAFMEKAGE